MGLPLDPGQEALTLLRTAVGVATADFRPNQWEAIEALLRRERLLVVERTGWGKSIVYFLATRLLRQRRAACTLLISPLLSLMRNQIEAAQRIGLRAETVNSENVSDWRPIFAALQLNNVDILLIAPEKLANDEFITKSLLPIAQQVGLLVVDEAHCISDWGHDFRPDLSTHHQDSQSAACQHSSFGNNSDCKRSSGGGCPATRPQSDNHSGAAHT